MCNKEKIYHLYFIEHKKGIEIANLLGVTRQTISKILQQFPEYAQEKERRKAENKEKHRQKTIEYIKQKRRENRRNNNV
ncbi:MAG: hypothetical protein PWR08_1367 [Thermoanaerobacterium sp.]|nr:hypothetical protein [Thermoanaerobacterium sp.]